MKLKTITLILFFLGFSTVNAQSYINIGSSKFDVKKVMGNPITIDKYVNEEVWGYGEFGEATITFKNNRIYEYKNYGKVLKIGNNKKKPISKQHKNNLKVGKKTYKDLVNDHKLKQEENPTFDMDAFFKEQGINPEDVGYGSKNFESQLVEHADDLDRLTNTNWQLHEDKSVYNSILSTEKSNKRTTTIISISLSILLGVLVFYLFKRNM